MRGKQLKTKRAAYGRVLRMAARVSALISAHLFCASCNPLGAAQSISVPQAACVLCK